MKSLRITRPDDWHLHLRDGPAMADVVAHSARVFGRAIVMPNLSTPVTTVAAARAYHDRILEALPDNNAFAPLMTLYLTERTPVEEIERAAASPHVFACKLYPAGATTNSEAGVRDIRSIDEVLAAMARVDLPLLVHGEVVDEHVDVFDRERVFIDEILAPLVERLPALRIVLEHVSTSEGVAFVRGSGPRIAATITPQHLLLDRNDLLAGRLRPHHYCIPVLKTAGDRAALVAAATSGEPAFFLGTDSAPHARADKECAHGCAGVFNAHAALEFYASVFDAANALEHLEAFASFHGPDFYGLPRNTGTVHLQKKAWDIPASYRFGAAEVVPLRADTSIDWRVQPDG